jgi:TrmH family RNA methyltransferase
MMAAPRLVLVRPRNADNLVSIAQAMAAFNLADWVAVSSVEHFTGMLDVLRLHRQSDPSHARVASLRRVDTLAEAVADCSWVVGTTMRATPGQPRFSTAELAQQCTLRHDLRWALVFGAESTGLLDDDVAQCHAASFIPSWEEQPSLNLAQAVVVYAFELARARTGAPDPAAPALADDATLRALEHRLVATLLDAGLCRDARGDGRTVDAVMATLRRAALTQQEAETWRRLWNQQRSSS